IQPSLRTGSICISLQARIRIARVRVEFTLSLATETNMNIISGRLLRPPESTHSFPLVRTARYSSLKQTTPCLSQHHLRYPGSKQAQIKTRHGLREFRMSTLPQGAAKR